MRVAEDVPGAKNPYCLNLETAFGSRLSLAQSECQKFQSVNDQGTGSFDYISCGAHTDSLHKSF
jgi:hypothetical protein